MPMLNSRQRRRHDRLPINKLGFIVFAHDLKKFLRSEL